MVTDLGEKRIEEYNRTEKQHLFVFCFLESGYRPSIAQVGRKVGQQAKELNWQSADTLLTATVAVSVNASIEKQVSKSGFRRMKIAFCCYQCKIAPLVSRCSLHGSSHFAFELPSLAGVATARCGRHLMVYSCRGKSRFFCAHVL